MTLEDEFYKAVSSWKDHCNSIEIHLSSNTSKSLDCNAYIKIVSMGEDVLPLIYDILAKKDWDTYFPIFGWVNALQEITKGDYKVPKKLRGRVVDIIDHAKDWLEANMHRYVD